MNFGLTILGLDRIVLWEVSMRFFVLIAFLAPLIVLACDAGATNLQREIRRPAVAGTFYPADSAKLHDLIADQLKNVTDSPEIDGRIVAIIVPHAGLIYSGQIAANSYRLLEGSDISTAIICGPAHRYPFLGLSVYGPNVAWQTPLGMVNCNDDICNKLLAFDKNIRETKEAYLNEHCIEVELPYLQMTVKDISIVPVLMGRPDSKTVDLLADALSALPWDDKTILIASTDWQHYHPASEGWPMDSLGMACLKALDGTRLQSLVAEGKVEACGGGGAAAVIKAAVHHGADKVKILKYGDSGDITGDKSSVVSYIAAVLYKSGAIESSLPEKEHLSGEAKDELLTIARQSIEDYLESGLEPNFDVSDELRAPGAAFVTLTRDGQLRGCIGYTEARLPLYQTVSHCAIQAAVADPRFRPVTRSELDNLHIEISVLTPLKKVTSLDEIKVGRDGLMIFKGANRGLLLPQVATEYGWDRETFLQQTCLKAGLPPDAYTFKEAELYKFQAVIFDEPK